MRRPSGFVKKGFTLSEALLAICLLAIVFAASVASFMNCFILNEANRSLAIATTHANYAMEEIKDKAATPGGFSGLVSLINSGNWNWNSATINNKGLLALNQETINTSVSGTDLLDITVSVAWIVHGRNRTISLESLVAEP